MIKEDTKLVNVELLIEAIVKCAVKDYKAELRHKKRIKNNETTKTIEKFIVSPYFESITGLNGKWIVEEIKSRIENSKATNKAKKARESRNLRGG